MAPTKVGCGTYSSRCNGSTPNVPPWRFGHERPPSIDRQLRIHASVWRMLRVDGGSRDEKRRTLDRIDRLLDERNTITSQQPQPAVPV